MGEQAVEPVGTDASRVVEPWYDVVWLDWRIAANHNDIVVGDE